MKKIILTLAAVSALGAATAASAQPARFAPPGVGVEARQAEISQRIERGLRDGSLTRFEAARLRVQLREVSRMENDFRRSRPGLTQREVAELNVRLDRVSAQVFDQRHDRQYGAGYGDHRRY